MTHDDRHVEILRDRYGVPHIFAPDTFGAYLGLGWCAAQDAPRSLPLHQLMLRGELAARFGDVPLPDPRFPFLDVMAGTTFFRHDGGRALKIDSLADVDRWVRQFGYMQAAREDLPSLKPRTQGVLQAFCDGVNRYYDQYEPGVHPRYEPETEIAWWAFHEHSLTIGLFGLSNAFAVAPSRTADGSAWIGGDPHYWIHHRSEVHLVSPEFELTGIWDGHVNVGAMGGSGTTRHIAMQGTAAALEAPSFYRERVNPRNREEYWDHRAEDWRPFETATHVIEVAGEPSRELVARATHHGPVVAELLEDGQPVAFTIKTPFDRRMGKSLEEYLEMWLVSSVDEALRYLHGADFSRGHRLLIDSGGNLGYAVLGPAPVRSEEVDWAAILDGADPRTEWGEEAWRPGDDTHPLPSYVNPASGFMQSANDASWFSTTPSPATRSDYPAYVFKPGWFELGSRGARQRQLLAGERTLTREDAYGVLFDVFVAHAHFGLASLQGALAADPDQAAGMSADAARLDALLSGWDGQATLESAQMSAAFWVDRFLDGGLPAPAIATTEDPSREPEMTLAPAGPDAAAAYVAALERAAAHLQEQYGRLEVPWGELHVFEVPDGTLGLPGGCNSLRALYGAWNGAWDAPDILDDEGVTRVNFGSHALRFASFGADGLEIRSCMLGGQLAVSEHPRSVHASDQARLFARQQLKRMPLTRAEVLADAEDAPDAHADCNHDTRTVLALEAAAEGSAR